MPDSPHPSPDDLLARYRARGDPDALGALFDAVAPSLYRVALSLLDDVHDADDALQSTFLALLQHPDRPDPSRPVVPWLVGVLRNEVLRVRRASRRRREPPGPVADAEATALLDDADVRRALEELPEPYRAPSLLRWRYGLTPAEIAHVRDEAPGTTRSLLARALARLSGRLRRTLAGAAPFASGLSRARDVVLKAGADAHARGARGVLRRSTMATERTRIGTLVVGTLVVGATLAVVVAWVATHLSRDDPPGERPSRSAGTRETAETPHVPTLSGPPAGAPSPADGAPALGEAPTTDDPAPPAVDDPAWPVPEDLRRIHDARVTTEAVLGAIAVVDQAFRSPVPIRLLELDSSQKVTRGLIRAETSSALDATTRALSELAVPLRRPVDVQDVDRTAARFSFVAAPPAEDAWEPGADLSTEILQPIVEAARPRGTSSIGALRVDAGLGLQRRSVQVRVTELGAILSLMRDVDAIRGVRVTQIRWTTDDSTGEVSATLELTLRTARPPK